MTPEEQAREHINTLLKAAGWKVQDKASVNLAAARGVAVCELSFKTGEPDYTLFVDHMAIGTVEAKPEGHSLIGVEEQSSKYVKGVPAGIPAWKNPLPFCYESTGTETRFTNLLDPEPRSRDVFSFHQPGTLLEWVQQDKQLNGRLRELPPLVTDHLWPAQTMAITKLEESFAQNRPRALIQMATGSGKTFTAVNFTYRLVKHAHARRVLFLVDRGNLGDQTLKEFQQFITPDDGRKFTELYNVQHLQSNTLDTVARVTISTIQRLYSMLKGEKEPSPDLDDLPIDSAESLYKEPLQVEYNPILPIETFDFIITDECHRSIYNLWRQVLEYFDAYLIGLTATPTKQTFGFFHQNLVMEYGHDKAVAEGVNVNYDVYRIRTDITEKGSKIESGFYVDKRDKLTRKMRWEQLDDDFAYDASQLDREVVAEDQIRTVLRTYRDKLFTEIFPGRTDVPKTLIYAKDDTHADDIVRICREVFDKGNDFCQKITYRTTGIRPRDLIASFRNSYFPRIAVTVDMIATGTDIKPLEVVFFMRSVRSMGFFEQMKGRGVRVISDTEFQGVTPDAKKKTRFVIVDAVGVCERDKGDSRPMERKRTVPFDKLLGSIALGNREPDALQSLAGRLSRLERLLDEKDKKELKALSGGKPLGHIARDLLDAVDPDVIEAKAKENKGPYYESTEKDLKEAAKALSDEAVQVIAVNPDFRNRLIELQRQSEQVIDTVSKDVVMEVGYSQAALDAARGLIRSWEEFISKNRDEITAIQLIYTHDKHLRFEQLRELAEAIEKPPRRWTSEALWAAYEKLEKTASKASDAKPSFTRSKRVLTDLITLVRLALHEDETLVPFPEVVRQRFDTWLAKQGAAGRIFTPEQITWLGLIRDHIATSLA
ncbi:MAG TPA: DEAD/DEAH box helicase family protein, partial [Deltaproteobacteria bacterium]|nr:DEAD/DEAH box helicase family protein [Deltaproteobacteria bacterium]